jgi:hypothetical protein
MKKQIIDDMEFYTIDVSKKVNWLKLFLIISIAGVATLSLMSLYQLYVLTITQ